MIRATNPRRAGFSKEMKKKRWTIIIKGVRRQATLAEIGVELGGITAEAVRQQTILIRAQRGEEVFRSRKPLWTTKEAAAEAGTTQQIVTQLCREKKIPYQRRGKHEYLLGRQGMAQLRAHPLVTRKRVCSECQRPYAYNPPKSHKDTCGKKQCQKQHRKRWREKYKNAPPTEGRLGKLQRAVWLLLQHHHIPKSEEWLGVAAAAERAGISQMQLTHLRERQIVATKDHPTDKWQGKRPVFLYSPSQMDVIKPVFSGYKKRRKKAA